MLGAVHHKLQVKVTGKNSRRQSYRKRLPQKIAKLEKCFRPRAAFTLFPAAGPHVKVLSIQGMISRCTLAGCSWNIPALAALKIYVLQH